MKIEMQRVYAENANDDDNNYDRQGTNFDQESSLKLSTQVI